MAHDIFFLPSLVALILLVATLLAIRGRRFDDTHVYGALFIGAIAFFVVGRLTDNRFGLLSDLVAVAANATCGWSWLLARTLFRKKAVRASPWPLAVVLLLVAAGAFLQFTGDSAGPITHMIGNVQGLVSSTVLLLALSEPLRDLNKDMSRAEQRFRFIFMGAYAGLVVVAVVWASGAPADSLTAQLGSSIKVACALLALAGGGLAIWYRGRSPWSDQDSVKRRVVAPNDDRLARNILRLMTDEAVYAVPDLKVADLARRLMTAEYKVTQCITGPLGFRNFNQMINHFRIEQASRQLADPGCGHLPILTIALDCGFSSIGPFNRAFKAQFGNTPTAFRDTHRNLACKA